MCVWHPPQAQRTPRQTGPGNLLPEPDASAFALPGRVVCAGRHGVAGAARRTADTLRAVQAPLKNLAEGNPEADAHPQMLELYFALQDLVRGCRGGTTTTVTAHRPRQRRWNAATAGPGPLPDTSLSTGHTTPTPPHPARLPQRAGCADSGCAGNSAHREPRAFCLPNISTPTATRSTAGRVCRITRPAGAEPGGDYLAFFPSYAYLRQVRKIAARYPGISTLVRESGLDDAAPPLCTI